MLDEATVRLLVRRGCTHKKISDFYQTLYPNTRGYSERSIRRFCEPIIFVSIKSPGKKFRNDYLV